MSNSKKSVLGLLFSAAFIAGTALSASGDVLLTSFEDPEAFSNYYIDTLDPLTDHALLDNVGEPWVNWYGGGAEIGFTSYYYNTRNDVGLSDGDFVGVTNYTGTVGAFTDGVNGFELQDTDGAVQTTFDTVNLSGGYTTLALDLFVQESGWETGDIADTIHIWAMADGSTMVDLIDTTGLDIDDLGIEGYWMTLTVDLSAYSSFALEVYLDSNASAESIFLDNIRLIPAPGAVTLLGLGGLILARRRRRS